MQVARKTANYRKICGKFPTACTIVFKLKFFLFRKLCTHYEKIFDTKFNEDFFLTLLKTDSFCSKPILNLFNLNSFQGHLEKYGAKNQLRLVKQLNIAECDFF